MNKTDLVATVAEKTGLTKKDAEKAVTAVFSAVEEALANGDKVQLVGFGTFEVRERKERKGQNPQTKKTDHYSGNKSTGFQTGQTTKRSRCQ